MLRNATKKYRDLKLKDCQGRTDQEVRENLLNSEDCEKQLDDLTISKEAFEQDVIGVHDAEFHEAIDMGTNKNTVEIKLDNDSKKPTVKIIALILIAAQKNKRRKSRHW